MTFEELKTDILKTVAGCETPGCGCPCTCAADVRISLEKVIDKYEEENKAK